MHKIKPFLLKNEITVMAIAVLIVAACSFSLGYMAADRSLKHNHAASKTTHP